MATTEAQIRIQFFDFIFGLDTGYICICTMKPKDRQSFTSKFFDWPIEREELLEFLQNHSMTHNVWFCVNLLESEERKKRYALPSRILWADLDTCLPENVTPRPQVVIESSPNRYQAIWRLERMIEARQAEDFSKRIAYAHRDNGVDISGWDLTQLLRVPFTRNFKYGQVPPQVLLLSAFEDLLPVGVFEALPEVAESYEDEGEFPTPDPLGLPSVEQILYQYRNKVNDVYKDLYATEPNDEEDWSRLLWKFLNMSYEAGMNNEEVFVMASNAGCNKYRRDDRPAKFLWRDVLKANETQIRITKDFGVGYDLTMPELVLGSEELPETFIDRYRAWASQATDASPHLHDLCCAILLSAIISQGISLETSYGRMIPNLWGLVLGESTVVRKTTVMRMAMDFIYEIDREIVLATDGSVEGILTGLSVRPSRTSMYYKDEVSGFLDALNKKDYLAGMAETFTQLYDVPPFLTRRLRKEIIDISNPIFIFFGGGIREKVHSLISEEYILSGFLPRFLIVAGEANLDQIRPTGPPTTELREQRETIKKEVADLYEIYGTPRVVEVLGQELEVPLGIQAVLTDDAWQLYGDMELRMVRAASEHTNAMLALPTFERLSRSILKLAMLLAASRKTPQAGKLEVDVADVKLAARHIQDWGKYTIDMLRDSGRTTIQAKFDRILAAIKKSPGINRGKIMQIYHLDAKEMSNVQQTLVERGQVIALKEGTATRFFPV